MTHVVTCTRKFHKNKLLQIYGEKQKKKLGGEGRGGMRETIRQKKSEKEYGLFFLLR